MNIEKKDEKQPRSTGRFSKLYRFSHEIEELRNRQKNSWQFVAETISKRYNEVVLENSLSRFASRNRAEIQTWVASNPRPKDGGATFASESFACESTAPAKPERQPAPINTGIKTGTVQATTAAPVDHEVAPPARRKITLEDFDRVNAEFAAKKAAAPENPDEVHRRKMDEITKLMAAKRRSIFDKK